MIELCSHLNPVAVIWTSDIAPVTSEEFLDIQAALVCGFTGKRVRDMIQTYRLIFIFENAYCMPY